MRIAIKLIKIPVNLLLNLKPPDTAQLKQQKALNGVIQGNQSMSEVALKLNQIQSLIEQGLFLGVRIK